MLRQVWPLVERALMKTNADERVAERLCRLLKYALRSAKGATGGAPMAKALASTLRTCFRSDSLHPLCIPTTAHEMTEITKSDQ